MILLSLTFAAVAQTTEPLEILTQPPVPEPAAAKEPIEDVFGWIMSYYIEPEPERLPEVLATMNREGMFTEQGFLIAPFMAEIYRRTPQLLETVAWPDDLDDDGMVARAAAIYSASVPRSKSMLEELAKDASEEMQPVIATMVATEPVPLLFVTIDDPAVIDMLWISFFAGGNPAYVRRIAEMLAVPDPEKKDMVALSLWGAARWSLTSNAREHAAVRAALRQCVAEGHVRQAEIEEVLTTVDRQLAERAAGLGAPPP